MKILGLASVLFATLALNGCSNYQMTVNETVVYDPPTLFTDFTTEDPKLRNCIDQAIKDSNATSPLEVTRLSCTHAGLTSLAGIEQFRGLTELQLSNNSLTNIEPLAQLGRLQLLRLENNQLQQATTLLSLVNLKDLNISENPGLACDDLKQLAELFTGNLVLPEQCL